MRKSVVYGYYVRHTNPEKQLREVLQRFKLFEKTKPFARCIRCNGIIENIDKSAIINQIPQQVRESYHSFYQCHECEQIYWTGTHYEKLRHFIKCLSREIER
jgi:uncharacterized protein with PIN domain